MRRWLRSLSVESWTIILVCGIDLVLTLVLIEHGFAEEGNPLMRFYLGYGVWAFVLAKSVLVLAPVVIMEWGRLYRPRTVKLLARAGIATYLGIYAGMFLLINVPAMSLLQRAEAVDAETMRMEQELRQRKLGKRSQAYYPAMFERYSDYHAQIAATDY